MRVIDVYNAIDEFAPFSTSEGFDNTGILVGSNKTEFQKAIIALDCTDIVIDEAISLGAKLIISHHPIIFNPLKKIGFDSLYYKLIKNDIAVISAHTNLDIAPNGVADSLCNMLSLKEVSYFAQSEKDSKKYFGRIGKIQTPLFPQEFVDFVKNSLSLEGIQYNNTKKIISKVAILEGSGGEFIYEAYEKGADAFVTGDVKHNIWIDSKHMGICLVDAGHYGTEKFVLKSLCNILTKKFGEDIFFVSQNEKTIINFR